MGQVKFIFYKDLLKIPEISQPWLDESMGHDIS